MSTSCNLVLVGVGGQGVLSAARLVGLAATEASLNTRVGQIYGLSQRGGSVEATVRIGHIETAFISETEADVVLGLEPLETERALPRMSATTIVLVNRTPIIPMGLAGPADSKGPSALALAQYPDFESTVAHIEAVAQTVYLVDGNALARLAGNHRLLNLVMLGALDGVGALPIPTGALSSVVERHGPSGDPETRTAAFARGREFGSEARLAMASAHDDARPR